MIEKNFQLFDTKFKVDKYLITTSDYWRLSVRPFQPTLGSTIISLNRPCENFADITSCESADLKEIVSYTEHNLKQAFKYDRINYLMLMMVDPHLHFHVIPRYSSALTFFDTQWSDNGWPAQPELGGREITDDEARNIIQAIKG